MCDRYRNVGAGKSTALKMLEDMGYFCVDNLPVPLIPKMAELLSVPGTEINKAALGVDIRSGQNFYELKKILKELDRSGTRFEILYLESSDDVLIKRYKETRRFHPLSGKDGRVEEGIKEERKRLEFLRERADYLIDSSHMLTRELRAELSKIFVENKEYKNLYISVLSFDSNTEYRQMQTLYLMYVFFLIRIILMNCVRKAGMTKKSGSMSWIMTRQECSLQN